MKILKCIYCYFFIKNSQNSDERIINERIRKQRTNRICVDTYDNNIINRPNIINRQNINNESIYISDNSTSVKLCSARIFL